MPFQPALESFLADLIVLYRQPILDLKTNEISHYEILARFNHDGKHHNPGPWVTALEDHGLCNLLDRQMLKKFSEYLHLSGDTARYSVNISGQTINLNGKFVNHLQSLNLPDSLIFEITETVMVRCCGINEQDQTCFHLLATLQYLSSNYSVAIDDFGVGAFRLAHLDYVRPSYLKIDGSFTKALPDPTNSADISALVSIAHARGCKVILEWVAEPWQIEYAREIGIDYAQGWAISQAEVLLQ